MGIYYFRNLVADAVNALNGMDKMRFRTLCLFPAKGRGKPENELTAIHAGISG